MNSRFQVLLHNLHACPFYRTCAFMCSCMCMNVLNSDLPLSSAPLFLCCADSLPPNGFRSAKLQSVGQHWSAPVWGLPAARQLGLPRQQLQLHPRGARGRGRASLTGDKPSTPPQWARDRLHRETMRRKLDTDWNTEHLCSVWTSLHYTPN